MFKKPTAKPFPGPPPSPNPKPSTLATSFTTSPLPPPHRASSPLPPGRANSPLPPPPPPDEPDIPPRKKANRISADFARASHSPSLASLRAAEGTSPNGRPLSIHRRAKSLYRASTQGMVDPARTTPAVETPVVQETGWGPGTTPTLSSGEGTLAGLAPPRRKPRPVSADGRPHPRGKSPEPPHQLKDDFAFRRNSIASPKLGGSPELERSPSGGAEPAEHPKRPSPVPTQPSTDNKSGSGTSALATGAALGPIGPADSSLSVPRSLPSSISIPSTSSSGLDLPSSTATAAAIDNFAAIPGPGLVAQPAVTVTVTDPKARHPSPGAPTERKRRPISISASANSSNRNSRYSFISSSSLPAPATAAVAGLTDTIETLAPELAIDTQLDAREGRQRSQSEQSALSATSSNTTPKPQPRPASRGTFGEAHGADSPISATDHSRDPSPSGRQEDKETKAERRKTMMRSSLGAGTNYAQRMSHITNNDDRNTLSTRTSAYSVNQIAQSSPLDELVEDLGGRPVSSASEAPSTAPTSNGTAVQEPRTSTPLPTSGTAPLHVSIPTVALTPAFSVDESPTSTDAERTLTLDQMEREIARMEAELALSGTPRASLRMFALDPMAHGPDLDDSFELPLPSPGSVDDRRASQTSLALSANSRFDNITPRTARKWSMAEVESAYERMKDMLGSTKSLKIDTSGGESEAGDVEGAFERALNGSDVLRSPSPLPRSSTVKALDFAGGAESPSGRPMSILEAEDDVLSLLEPEALTSQPNTPTKSPKRTSAFDRAARHSTGTTKPLNLPTVSVDSPNAGRNHSIASSADSVDHPGIHERELVSSPATSPPNSAVALQLKASVESLAVPTRTSRAGKRHTMTSVPTLDKAEDVFSSPGRKGSDPPRGRRGSDSGGTRPGLGSTRLVRSRTLDSGRSISDLSDTGTEDVGWATPQTSMSKDRKGARSPAQRSNSRLSLTAPLRSGAGREMQKWVTDGDASDAGAPPSTVGSVAESRQAAAQAAKDKADAFAEERKAKRQSKQFLTKSSQGLQHGMLAATTDSWFPITPDRASHRRQSTRTNTTTTSGFSSSQPTSPLADVGDKTFASEMSHASLNMASVRSMDKLEIFFKYTATKAELDKAALERDALLDALAESRATLADVRRQRDEYEKQAKHKRAAEDPHLGSKEDRAKWDDLRTLKETWEERAKTAVRLADKAKAEIDTLRRELQDGKAREEQLERETVMMGARLAAAEAGKPSPSPRIQNVEFAPRAASPKSRKLVVHVSSGSGSGGGSSRGPSRIGRLASAPGSPVQTGMSRSHSQNTVVMPGSPAPASPAPSSPAAQIASAFRQREAEAAERGRKVSSQSTASAATTATATSLSSSTALDLQLDSSPLLQQSPSFNVRYHDGAKSSWGSLNSPLKAKAQAAVVATIPRGSPGQFSRMRLPQPGSPTKQLENRVSTYSLASADGSEFGDHLPPKEERGWNGKGSTGPGGLRAADEAFLADLRDAGESD